MSRKKKEDGSEAQESSGSLVSVLSMRPGDVMLPSGEVLKYQQVSKLDEAEAEWALASFPEYVKKI